MSSAIRNAFQNAKRQGKPAFAAFLTAGYPTVNSTVDLMFALEKGGADIIELGVPFSDPIADGPAIQNANTIAVSNGISYTECLQYVRGARKRGLQVPVVLMGYYNPILAYGKAAVSDAASAGVSGFIVVDWPPEAAVHFRATCLKEGLSYIPLIAPSTSPDRIKSLADVADSFIYVVSRMGTTGSSEEVSRDVSALLDRIRACSSTYLVVGFNISNRRHFKFVSDCGADGVAIGSRIINIIEESVARGVDTVASLQEFCHEVTGIPEGIHGPATPAPVVGDHERASNKGASVAPNKLPQTAHTATQTFGEFGGQYVPESLMGAVTELAVAHAAAVEDPKFWDEVQEMYEYMGRPSNLYLAERLTEHVGGARIWFKREDLNHTGSHKINNAIGQILLARRLGKTRIIAETGAGQHGVATATVCARFGLECCIYMGEEDVRRQALNVFRMRMLGAQVISVASGSRTLKDAVSEAMRDWVTNLDRTHFLIGSPIGPHPCPTIVRDFQKVIGKEIKAQMLAKCGKLPDAVVACVGGGSNAIGSFHQFLDDKSVRLIGCEAAGEGVFTPKGIAQPFPKGSKGVLHGVHTYLLQSKTGQITETYSVSAGLDYPGVGPEHAFLKDTGRAEYVVADDEQALRGFRLCTQLEGIIPALESSHAIWAAVELAKTMPSSSDIVLCLSGRGDKDVHQISELLAEGWAERLDWNGLL